MSLHLFYFAGVLGKKWRKSERAKPWKMILRALWMMTVNMMTTSGRACTFDRITVACKV